MVLRTRPVPRFCAVVRSCAAPAPLVRAERVVQRGERSSHSCHPARVCVCGVSLRTGHSGASRARMGGCGAGWVMWRDALTRGNARLGNGTITVKSCGTNRLFARDSGAKRTGQTGMRWGETDRMWGAHRQGKGWRGVRIRRSAFARCPGCPGLRGGVRSGHMGRWGFGGARNICGLWVNRQEGLRCYARRPRPAPSQKGHKREIFA